MDAMMPQAMPTPMQAPGQQMAQALVPQPKPVTHDVVIVTTKKASQARVMGVPPEEFGIERGARTIKDCNYCFHETQKSVGSLVGMGYDEKQLKELISTGDQGTESLSRDTVGEYSQLRDSTNETARLVRVTEHYIRMDYEGNGKTCIYRVTTGGEGGDILKLNGKDDIEKVDGYPFAAASPVPQPHRFFGRSIADLVMQIQREKTAMKRGALDNMYLHNNPRPEIAESHAGVNTIDDLLVSRHGAPIRTKQPGGLAWQVVPDITGSIYPMLQYLDADLEAKTGLSKQTQGIDANALQNQSATAVAQVFSSSQLRVKLIARVLAEGVRDMFAILHHTIRSHGQEEATVRLRNKWVPVDPRNWKTRDDMTINVGLGTGGKAQQFAQTMALANFQKELLLGGKAHLVGDDKLFNTASELTKIMGHKNPDKFFDDPSEKGPDGQLKHPPVQPPPDPKVMAIQEQAKNDQQELALKAELDKQKAQDAAQLAQFKAEIDAKLKIIEAHMKSIEMERKARTDQQQHHAKLTETALGMVADAHSHDLKTEQNQQAHEANLTQMKNAPKPKGGE
jgi:hypothetical protein